MTDDPTDPPDGSEQSPTDPDADGRDAPDEYADGPSPERVREALADVTDPDLGGDVVASGLVESVDVDDGVVTVRASFAGLDDETSDVLVDRIRTAILGLPGVERAQVSASGGNPGQHAEAPQHHGGGHHDDGSHGGPHRPDDVSVPGVDRVLAVASAKGGVGKTTVATQLARALSAGGETVGLFDADVYGPNVPSLLDVDDVLGATDDGRAKPVDADGIQTVSVGFIANDEPLAWRGAMAQEAVVELLGDAAWRDVDTLVLDLPPGTGDVVLTVLQSVPVDAAVLVTTPFATATSDTARSATLFREQGIDLLGAVHNMASFVCPSCGDAHSPFTDDGNHSTESGDDVDPDVDVLAELPLSDAMRDATGDVPDEFDALADAVAAGLEDLDGVDLPPEALDLRGVPDRARHDQVRAEYDALEAGEALFVRTDRDPNPLASALADAVDGPPPTVDVDRRGPEEYALRLGVRDPDACECHDHAAGEPARPR
ncbi:P-loop NTPase [Halorubellus sp. JP-L1]|uniref:P-loop NTPase n=1 Tax=Halorubellus sp. JP-L1 TaxID=2715753 RepID=UPI001408EF73|nr:P-loop NTPase [Halorubellus sp. JP-L1]NHN42784.1 P-loop NTPase [Halorubellus sp. JP-L1]